MKLHIQTYSFTFSDAPKWLEDKLVHVPERGCEVKKNGYAEEGRLIAMDEKTVVVAFKGYSENPGSRYSGLRDYYPAMTEVFHYSHTDDFGRRRYVSLIEWQTRAPKKTHIA